MVLEVAVLNVRAGQAAEFEAAFQQAAPLMMSRRGSGSSITFTTHFLRWSTSSPWFATRLTGAMHRTVESMRSRPVGTQPGAAAAAWVGARRRPLRLVGLPNPQ